MRAYTLPCNGALSLARPNLENLGIYPHLSAGNLCASGRKYGNFILISQLFFWPCSPSRPQGEKSAHKKNAFRRPYSGQFDHHPYKGHPPTQKTRADQLCARLKCILNRGGWVVFQNPSFLGGFLAGEIHLAGTDWKQACPEQPKTLGVSWIFVCPVVNSLGVIAMAACTHFP